MKFTLEVTLDDTTMCTGCPFLSISKRRGLLDSRTAFCAARRQPIKYDVENRNEVKRPKWCPLKSVSTCPWD